MKQLFLHVGMHKTGSSSIQKFFRQNWKSFDNLLYPDFSNTPYHQIYTNHSVPIYGSFSDNAENYHMFKRAGLSPEKITEKQKAFKKSFIEYLKFRGYNHLLLSGEDISVLSKNALASLKSFVSSHSNAEIHVICYVREPLDFIRSQIQQQIKGGFTAKVALERNLNTCSSRYLAVLDNLSEVFGASMRVFKYEDARERGLITHFLEQLGYEASMTAELEENPSICVELAEVLSYINKSHPPFATKEESKSRLLDDLQLLYDLPGSNFFLEDDYFNLIKDDFNNLIRNLKSKYNIEYQPRGALGNGRYSEIIWSSEALSHLEKKMKKLDRFFRATVCEFLELKKKDPRVDLY